MSEWKKRHEWMDGDNPFKIGGRSTDVSQIGHSLSWLIRNAYPINGVPAQIEQTAKSVSLDLAKAEKGIETLLEMVSDDLAGTTRGRHEQP